MKSVIFALSMIAAVPVFAGKHCDNPIKEAEVKATQKAWGNAIVAIGKAQNAKAEAQSAIDRLYGYDEGTVLFKPTLSSKVPFRGTKESALSYFVRGDVAEDKGFALAPYTQVRFVNEGIITHCDTALSMGQYFFKKTDGSEIMVKYTFGYVRDAQGDLKINLHHSSLPYQPE